jgi:hypothetical protein
MIRLNKLTPALAVAAITALATAPGALAAAPAPQDLNPAPPDYYDCRLLGAGTICMGDVHSVKISEEQPDLVCDSGASAFLIHDTGVRDSRFTRWYNADGDLTRRLEHEVVTDAFWSNPLSGKTLPYTQRATITTVLAVPGDFESATETTMG